jgi:hypothetical protein
VRFCIVRPRFFIELAFHHPQCGWFYRLNVTGLRKKNCGFNFRISKVIVRGFTYRRVHTIATAHVDYAKKAIQDGTDFWTRLTGLQSPEQAMVLQTEFAQNFLSGVHRGDEADIRALCRPARAFLRTV